MIKKWAKELNRHFSKTDTQMANSHMKIHPALQVTKEMLIKTTMRYHVTSVRMGTIKKKKSQKITNIGKNVKKLESLCTVVGNAK